MAAGNLLRLHAIHLAVLPERLCGGQVQQFFITRLLVSMLFQRESVKVESSPPAQAQRDEQGCDAPLKGRCEHVRKLVTGSPLDDPFVILRDVLVTGLLEMTIRDGPRFPMQLVVTKLVGIAKKMFRKDRRIMADASI